MAIYGSETVILTRKAVTDAFGVPVRDNMGNLVRSDSTIILNGCKTLPVNVDVDSTVTGMTTTMGVDVYIPRAVYTDALGGVIHAGDEFTIQGKTNMRVAAVKDMSAPPAGWSSFFQTADVIVTLIKETL